MKGINFVTNDQNQQVAVMIDLKKYGALWEDFYDYLIASMRKNEEKVPFDKIVKDLKKSGRLK